MEDSIPEAAVFTNGALRACHSCHSTAASHRGLLLSLSKEQSHEVAATLEAGLSVYTHTVAQTLLCSQEGVSSHSCLVYHCHALSASPHILTSLFPLRPHLPPIS